MSNQIKVKGILRNITFSHTIGDVEYNKAELLVPRDNGKEDLLDVKFKKFSNNNEENSEVALSGNLRTFTEKQNDKNKVHHYIFTYFDVPEECDQERLNDVIVSGHICKLGELTTLKNQKQLIRFVLANKIEKGSSILTSYLHCVGFGVVAKELSECSVNDVIEVYGELHSREYKKILDDEGNFEIRIAHEVFTRGFEVL